MTIFMLVNNLIRICLFKRLIYNIIDKYIAKYE